MIFFGITPFLLVIIILLMFRPIRFLVGWGIVALAIYFILAHAGIV